MCIISCICIYVYCKIFNFWLPISKLLLYIIINYKTTNHLEIYSILCNFKDINTKQNITRICFFFEIGNKNGISKLKQKQKKNSYKIIILKEMYIQKQNNRKSKKTKHLWLLRILFFFLKDTVKFPDESSSINQPIKINIKTGKISKKNKTNLIIKY